MIRMKELLDSVTNSSFVKLSLTAAAPMRTTYLLQTYQFITANGLHFEYKYVIRNKSHTEQMISTAAMVQELEGRMTPILIANAAAPAGYI